MPVWLVFGGLGPAFGLGAVILLLALAAILTGDTSSIRFLRRPDLLVEAVSAAYALGLVPALAMGALARREWVRRGSLSPRRLLAAATLLALASSAVLAQVGPLAGLFRPAAIASMLVAACCGATIGCILTCRVLTPPRSDVPPRA